MDNNQHEKLHRLNDELINNLNSAKDKAKKTWHSGKSIYNWENPEVLENILIPNLKDLFAKYNNDVVMLAKFEVGLSQWLDYYYYDWDEGLKFKIDKVASEIYL